MDTKKQYPIFKKSMAGVITIIVLGSVILARGTKEKGEFNHMTGRVTLLEKTYQELPIRHPGKYRYLSIDSYPKVFQIFIGKDAGDFKPKLEKVDDLKIGDEIVVYYDEDPTETDIRLNRLIQFIDKDFKPYFIKGSWDKFGGYLFIGLGLFFGVLILILKEKGRIL